MIEVHVGALTSIFRPAGFLIATIQSVSLKTGNTGSLMVNHFQEYAEKLAQLLKDRAWTDVEHLAETLYVVWKDRRKVFLCGNGGSAGNAIHIANDFLYGIGQGSPPGLDVEALTANPAILTCLANDIDYNSIFSTQIQVKGGASDLLIVLSGSGNSQNVIRALQAAKQKGLETCAIVGFDGGVCRQTADQLIHFQVEDMQMSEDFQLIVGHMCMQWLNRRILASSSTPNAL